MKSQITRRIVVLWKDSALFHQIERIVNYHFRRRLRNDDFTILCSNCVGGLLYHRLGKRFLTPTLNMWFKQPDFVEFCLHLDEYLTQELVFLESEEPYPVATLPGNGKDIPAITLYFNHFKTAESAAEKWNERKQRLVRNNLYVMMYNLDGVTVEQLHRLDDYPCRAKVVFTPRPLPEISWSYYIEPVMKHKNPYNYLEKDILGICYLEKKFDFVSFFNS